MQHIATLPQCPAWMPLQLQHHLAGHTLEAMATEQTLAIRSGKASQLEPSLVQQMCIWFKYGYSMLQLSIVYICRKIVDRIMYVCTYVRMQLCSYVALQVCRYVGMQVCRYVCMYVGMYENMYIGMYVMYVICMSCMSCLYVRMCVCVIFCN